MMAGMLLTSAALAIIGLCIGSWPTVVLALLACVCMGIAMGMEDRR